MGVPAESRVPSANPPLDRRSLLQQGAVAGIFGAALLAAWFLYRDVVQGKPLFTPTLLATALLKGGSGLERPEALEPSIGLTLLFTALHTLVFAAIGVGAAELLYRFAHVRNRALLALVLFAALCLGFFAVALNVFAVGPQAIAVRDALIGNAIAAFAMAAYLARNLPEGRRR